ncbi:MAG: hypothetical protein ACPGWR_29500 [Ardenticatenaceae bacterium]
MKQAMLMTQTQTALKYDVEVIEEGVLQLDVPFSRGTRLLVFVLEEPAYSLSRDTFDDLLQASESSLDFWDNPFDDEDWNNA